MIDNNGMVKRRTPEEINAYIDGYISAINRFIKNLEDSNSEDAIRRMRIILEGLEMVRVKEEGERMSESARSTLKHLYEEGRMTEEQYQKIDRNLKERPHGEWIVLPRGSFECPNCQGTSKVKYMFCHWCGADMRPKEGEAK